MRIFSFLLLTSLLVDFTTSPALIAEEKPLPPPDRTPQLILASTHAHAPVNALAFSNDGNTLYVGGFDKQVRRYRLVDGKFTPIDSIRVPIGPGNAGVVNCIAVSPDGEWVAVAGRAPVRGELWSGSEDGIGAEVKRLPEFQRRDAGVVYLFNPKNPNGGKVIRGPQAGVRALAFANPAPAGGSVLITAGTEWNEKGELKGTVRIFNTESGKEIASRRDLPASNIPPGLAAWPTGAKNEGLRIVVAWDATEPDTGKLIPSKLLTWDNPGSANPKSTWDEAALLISPLAVQRNAAGAATELIHGGFDPVKNIGGLKVRNLNDGTTRTTELKNSEGRLLLPNTIAAFRIKERGDATAVLLPTGKKGEDRVYELRLLTAKAERGFSLGGFQHQPVLAASPDGRFLAVGGFRDNRVEIHDTHGFLAQKSDVQQLAGEDSGFSKMSFLSGDKIWLGRISDSLDRGGIIIDLDGKARVATPRGAKEVLKVDVPEGAVALTPLAPDLEKKLPARVAIRVAGVEKIINLPDGEIATAAAYLPGKPVWAPGLGPVVAIAHVHQHSQTVMVTLFNAATGKPMIYMSGPTLPIRSLAFSGTRALLAAAGDDGALAVWSLKAVDAVRPAIEGLLIAERDGQVVVTAASNDGILRPDDVIESVSDPEGKLKEVKSPIDFVLAIREHKIGTEAKIKVKGKQAAAVRVGSALGFRNALFSLWVDPREQEGRHEWVGWSPAGPYDASSDAAEARIGWLSATGDPARPVAFAGANQYRKRYYKRDIIKFLIEKADYQEAIGMLPKPREAVLIATLPAAVEERGGQRITRGKVEGVEVSLSDPDTVISLDQAVLQWRVTGPGAVGDWQREGFGGGTAALDLSKHSWVRGEHRVHMKLFENAEPRADIPPVLELTVVIGMVPPAPRLIAQLDGKPIAAGAEVTTEKEEIEVGAIVDAKANPDGATVTLSWSGGGASVELVAEPNGTFQPRKVKVKENDIIRVLVTATNRGDRVNSAEESDTIEFRVRKVAPEAVPPPPLKLQLHTAADVRKNPTEPYVVSEPVVQLSATVGMEKPEVFEWKIGNGKWVAATPDKNGLEMRQEKIPDDGKLEVQVRAKVKNSTFTTDSLTIHYEPLPEVSVSMPPVLSESPSLPLSGGLVVKGNRVFDVWVVVTSSRTGETREFKASLDPANKQWKSGLTLFPGGNQLGYVIKYDADRKEHRRERLVEVRYQRPPKVVAFTPVDAGSGAAGDLYIMVLSPTELPPTELLVNDARVGFQITGRTPIVFGPSIWRLKAESVSVNDGDKRLQSLKVLVRNADGESQVVGVTVEGKPPVRVPPPTILLSHPGGTLTALQTPVVAVPRFPLSIRVHAENKLTRLEVWHAVGSGAPVEVGKINLADQVAAAEKGGFDLLAAPVLRLRPGDNHIKVVAASAGREAVESFSVSYTPPPVRIVLDAIREPGQKWLSIPESENEKLVVETPVIEVAGRVIWDYEDEPIGQERNLTVVFSANGVAHMPVIVLPAEKGQERKFTGRVFMNSTGNMDPNQPGETRIKVDLRIGDRSAPVPQEGFLQAAITVASTKPLRQQRLHVVILGVEIPEREHRELAQRVVKAIGGEIPDNNPNFMQGRFNRRNFEVAYLYSPRLGYTQSGDLNTLLLSVRKDIGERMKSANENWVNDVIIIYYHGEDWVEDGRWLLHSASTLSGAAGKKAADHAIRLDNLPQIPGLPVAVVNVSSLARPDGKLTVDMPFLRYAWSDLQSMQDLFPVLAKATREKQRVKEISLQVEQDLKAQPKPPDRTANLPADVLARFFGQQSP